MFKKAFIEFALFLAIIGLVFIIFLYSFYAYANIQVPLLKSIGFNFPKVSSLSEYKNFFLMLQILPFAISKSINSKTELKFLDLYFAILSFCSGFFVYNWIPVSFLGCPELNLFGYIAYVAVSLLSFTPLLILFGLFYLVYTKSNLHSK